MSAWCEISKQQQKPIEDALRAYWIEGITEIVLTIPVNEYSFKRELWQSQAAVIRLPFEEERTQETMRDFMASFELGRCSINFKKSKKEPTVLICNVTNFKYCEPDCSTLDLQ